MNPPERDLTHPVNPFVAQAEADRLCEEALTVAYPPVRAVDVARPVAIRHRRAPKSVVPQILAAVGIAVAVDAAIVMGLLAGLEVLGRGTW